MTPVTPDSIVGYPRPDLSAVAAPSRRQMVGVSHQRRHTSRDPRLNRGALVRWSPDGNALWVLRPGAARQRGVDRLDVFTGRTTPLFTIDELQGVATPFVAMLSVADDGKSYVYFTATYNSLLFSVEGIR